MFSTGDLIKVRPSLLTKNPNKFNPGWALVIKKNIIDLEECFMVSYVVLLSGKLYSIDASQIIRS